MPQSHRVGYVAASLLVVSSFAHAFAGWPELAIRLAEQSVDADTIGTVAAGWFFGSVAMLTFGTIVGLASFARARGKPPSFAAILAAVAVAYVGFGMTGYVLREFRAHFLGFVALGLLTGWGALLAAGGSSGTVRPPAGPGS